MRAIRAGDALLLAIAVIATTVACSGQPAPSRPPPPTSRPAPTDAGAWPAIVWIATRSQPARGAGDRRLVAVASKDSAVVAVGYDDFGAVRNGFAMVAGQTLDFQPAENLDILTGVELVDVTDAPRGFVAIGTEAGVLGGATRVVIVNSEDGRSWQRVPDDPIFADAYAVSIARGPGGLLAIGAGESGHDWPIWRSTDGLAWSRVAPAELGLPAGGLAALDGSPERWLGIGAPLGAVVTDSTDGLTWHATELPPTGRPGVKPPIVERVVAGRWGWLATGMEPVDCGFLIWEGDCPAERAAWWSDGLGDWAALPEDSFAATLPSGRIVDAGDRGLLAVAGSGAWSSIDGLGWLPLDLLDEPTVAVADAVVVGDRFVAVGETFNASNGSSGGWIGIGTTCCN